MKHNEQSIYPTQKSVLRTEATRRATSSQPADATGSTSSPPTSYGKSEDANSELSPTTG
jgi:hypothetical protein